MELRRTLLCTALAAMLGICPASEVLAGGKKGKTRDFSFAIVGTHIEYDAFGLPAFLAGDVYYRGGKRDGKFAGTYEEDLTPIFFGETFVGTSGVAVFKLKRLNEFTTMNTSYIVGFGNGIFLVESSGQIVDGKGKFKHVTGGFSSTSSIILGPEFLLDVALTLSVTFDFRDDDDEDDDGDDDDHDDEDDDD